MEYFKSYPHATCMECLPTCIPNTTDCCRSHTVHCIFMVPTVRGIRMVVPWKPVNLQEDEEGEEMYEEMDEGVLASFSR